MLKLNNYFHKDRKFKKIIPKTCLYAEDLMSLAIDIAHENINYGRGPFGAVIADKNGHVISIGYNTVVESKDSTSHAEINAIRAAQQKLGFDLSPFNLVLYSSSEPCIQCFGAIYISGIKEVYSACTKEDVEKIGFQEGPTSNSLWENAKKDKGIIYTSKFCRNKKAISVLLEYKKKSGVIY